jgi:TnpA family transposase
VTDLDILAEVHQRRASARIFELRHLHGYTITGTLETKNGARFARYTLHEQPEQLRIAL